MRPGHRAPDVRYMRSRHRHARASWRDVACGRSICDSVDHRPAIRSDQKRSARHHDHGDGSGAHRNLRCRHVDKLPLRHRSGTSAPDRAGGLDNRRKSISPIVSVAREQTHPRALAAHHEPETIVFDLMHPIGPGRRPGNPRRAARFDKSSRPEGGTLTQQHGAKIGEKIGRRESRNQKNCGHGGQKSWPISGAPPGSTLKAEFHKRIQLKIGRVKPHRVVSGASDFRNDSWAQALKNISALSGCLYRAAEEMECRPRNFTKDA